ncbi:MAG: CotH kinase family protein [Bacteroidia bacterium]|jgi:hypothetical protein|nr:CotH kinase family protein [Bacteroidia bacterium]
MQSKPTQHILTALLCLTLNATTLAQSIDHWESAVYNTDQWSYFVGSSEPSSLWIQPSFNATAWPVGQGGFGYEDGDDNTTIAATSSVYIRTAFNLIDTAAIEYLILHADYDDAFVAYLNGTEIARNNIGAVGTPPTHDALANTFKEAQIYAGNQPESYEFSTSDFRSFINEGSNTLAIQIHNQSPTSSDLSSNFFLTLGLSDNSNNYRNTPEWFLAPNMGSSLPIFVITTDNNTEIVDEPKIDGNLGIINNAGRNKLGDAFTGYDGRIGIEIRGASSQSFPKNNFGFETRLANGENNNVSLLGMPEENDWILHGPYSDKSLLRNVLAYHLGTETGEYTPRTQLCELYINEDYRGVYMLTEKIKRDKNRVNIANLKEEDIGGEELTGGYLLQIDRDDESTELDGWRSNSFPQKFYAFHDPNQDELQPAQREYIETFIRSFETSMASSNYVKDYTTFVDRSSWINYFLATEIGKHIDAYKLSFYMHKKKFSNGGKLHFGPLWDFNLGFGNFDFVCSPDPQGWTYEFQGTCDNSHPFWVKKMTNIPEVSNQINCRWQELREGAWHTDSLMQFLDDRLTEMGDAPDRNFQRWPTLGTYVWPNSYVGDTYEDEVNFLKTWLTQRLAWMDANMLGDCNLASIKKQQTESKRFSIFPNPTAGIIYVESYLTNNQGAVLRIFNALGAEVAIHRAPQTINKLDISSLSKGVYTLKLYRENTEIGFEKLVVR